MRGQNFCRKRVVRSGNSVRNFLRQKEGEIMSEGANKAFKNDPQTFLRNNVILIREGQMPYQAGRYRVNLRPVNDDQVTDDQDNQLGVYVPFLAQANPTLSKDRNVRDEGDTAVGRMAVPGASKSWYSHQFYAWYVPWGPNKSFLQRLGTNADFFFTPGLTGCTFAAVGSGNTPTVGHFNYLVKDTDKVSPERTARHVEKHFGGQTGALLNKADYLTPDGAIQRYSYIVGWRTNHNWEFVAQYIDHVGAGKGRILKRETLPTTLQFVHNL
jgi:hypothetical protein